MLSLFPQPRRGIPRRAALSMGAMSAGGLLLPQTVGAAETALGALSHTPTAKRCISIYLCGGPSQPDLWDLKLDAPSGIRTYFNPISTAVPGLPFGELIPQVARHADKLAFIRSMTHTNNDHNGAIAHTLMGQLPRILTDFYTDRGDHPGLGAILQKVLGKGATYPRGSSFRDRSSRVHHRIKGSRAAFLARRTIR